MRDLNELVRANIKELEPYSSARNEYKAQALAFLDANENPYNSPYNRYPDPLQGKLKEKLAVLKGVGSSCIFLGNGSDEAIDLVFRIFCEPKVDNVVAIDPTYGMYEVCASVNDVEYRKVRLDDAFQFKAEDVLYASDRHTKVAFLCSPNNPTGNNLSSSEIKELLERFDGMVVLDEAYADFSSSASFLPCLSRYPNLVILQTFSKAWGCAGMRLGVAFASPSVIAYFNKVKYPYNVNALTQEKALEMLEDVGKVDEWVDILLRERERLMQRFAQLACCVKVYPTDANFFLAKVQDAERVYNHLACNGVIVRNRSKVALCGECLRITVGTPVENDLLIKVLKNYV